MACWLANISQLFSKIIWFCRFFTPQSALWPIQNTTKRFVAYLFKTPQSALWPTHSKHHKALCGLLIQNTTKRFVAYYSKHHKALCDLPIQNTTKHFVVVIIIIAIFRWSNLLLPLCKQHWQRDSLIWLRFPHNPYMKYACNFLTVWLQRDMALCGYRTGAF